MFMLNVCEYNFKSEKWVEKQGISCCLNSNTIHVFRNIYLNTIFQREKVIFKKKNSLSFNLFLIF